MYLLILIILFIGFLIFSFFNQPKFGKRPTGDRLEKIKQSPNYKDGAFQNLSFTPDLTEGATYLSVTKEYFFGQKKRITPVDNIPTQRTYLHKLDNDSNVLVWFGHSSYFMQIDGKRILVDPVLSGHASPFSFTTKAFTGTDIYSTNDIPEIDYLFITHDHWDHLDYETIKKLKPKIRKIICGLGVGEHLEHWGYDKSVIVEADWNSQLNLDPGFTVYTIPARHFSGRGLKRNQALWTSFVLQTLTLKIFIGGDSGYDYHFAETGKLHGEFDLVILENGQYDKNWKYIHLMPEEVLKAAKELNAKKLLSVHHGKFAIANHAWDHPLVKIAAFNIEYNVPLLTPMIGEAVYLNEDRQMFTEWWKGLN